MLFQGQDETVRIVSMNKDFHVKCYVCEVRCPISLSYYSGLKIATNCSPVRLKMLCWQPVCESQSSVGNLPLFSSMLMKELITFFFFPMLFFDSLLLLPEN